ncbi:5-(carboxyamino)imidazole ribonucleotide synthase [Candidatus Erwinia haradaeae]|uniref:N5-carboxyaminoimidazole ribonucleotide synthase n=1 Tax=Candidatus Erwinia haradaeae TaxID=1922217 RepID=A0A451DHN3_9GAMM|nr:5-(carboxyamino)imidazole ribonucleotide synthase [Candidatus Erwinia haradaeae]VFP86152.1 N5-carboxyaminoimidazole ribonucleotide synthase [Candidatus Erwinia haradaeae]
MKLVYVLGDGQLGHMLRQAGEPLGVTVHLIALNSDLQMFSVTNSVITTEIEYWPNTVLTQKLSKSTSFVNRDIFPVLTDRLSQKKLLNDLNLATAPWELLSCKTQWPQIFSTLGQQVIVKCRNGGYNGHGQWHLCLDNTETVPETMYGKCIVEKKINFSNELSLIGARGRNGDTVFYPLTYNFHQNGILRASVVLINDNTQQNIAEHMLSMIMHKLNYIGVMTMECFMTSKGLLINELSARVHNSGHWTQDAASINQFELHLRAILDLPLPTPVIYMPAVMLNLIGINSRISWLAEPRLHLHWYNKTVYHGRKVGHINLVDVNPVVLNQILNSLLPTLPIEYADYIMWVKNTLFQK